MNIDDNTLYALIFVIIFVVTGVLFVQFLMRFSVFSFELRRVNDEIKRTHGEEKQHWKRVRRRLWLSLLPFIKYR